MARQCEAHLFPYPLGMAPYALGAVCLTILAFLAASAAAAAVAAVAAVMKASAAAVAAVAVSKLLFLAVFAMKAAAVALCNARSTVQKLSLCPPTAIAALIPVLVVEALMLGSCFASAICDVATVHAAAVAAAVAAALLALVPVALVLRPLTATTACGAVAVEIVFLAETLAAASIVAASFEALVKPWRLSLPEVTLLALVKNVALDLSQEAASFCVETKT